jgi:hypothetical protein
MAQRGEEKSQLQSDWGGKGNFGVKPGLGLCVFHKSLLPEAVSGFFLHDGWVSRSAGRDRGAERTAMAGRCPGGDLVAAARVHIARRAQGIADDPRYVAFEAILRGVYGNDTSWRQRMGRRPLPDVGRLGICIGRGLL